MPTQPPVTVRWSSRAHDHLWTDPVNWTPGRTGPGIVARFGRGGSKVDLATADGRDLLVGQVEVWGGLVQFSGGTLHAKASPVEKRLYSQVGLRIDGGGRLMVAADTALLGMSTVAIGDVSGATLDLRGALTDAQVYVGRAGAVDITVEGAAARWDTAGIDQSFQLGGTGVVTMVIRDGGHVTDGAAWSNLNAATTMTIGGTTAGASLQIIGRDSMLRYQILDVGGAYDGTLDIASGARVLDYGGNVGESGDGTVTVSGAGSAWDNLNGLFVHGEAPHGSVTVTDRATLRFGEYGLQDGGSVAIDASAHLIGATIVMGGGAFSGLADSDEAASTVTVTQAIELSYNPALGGSNVGNFFGSAAGVSLILGGAVTALGAYDPFAVGGGHVVLANTGNGDFNIALYGGVLEVAQAGASGSGGIAFLDSAGAMLEIDQTGTLANPISGFALSGPDVIDLAAVLSATPPTVSWQPASGHAILDVSDGTHSVGLALGTGYNLAHFTAGADGHGGTALSYHG